MTARAATHRENVTAAAIITLAVVVAAWLLNHHPVIREPPKLFEPPAAPRANAPPAASPRAQLPLALNIELVELPPAPSAKERPRAQAAPQPPPTQQARQPVMPPAPLVAQAPPPKAAEAPKTIAQPLSFVPLKAEIATSDAGTLPVTPLRAKKSLPPPAPKPFEPFKAETRPQPAFKPLTPEPERTAARNIPAKSFEPLRPEPEPPPHVQQAALQPSGIEEPREAPLRVVPRQLTAPKTPTKLRLPPVPAEQPARQERARAQATPAVLTTTSAGVTEGRALLRIFEQGSGPGIQIQWPSDPGDRARLYDAFVRCLGMRVGMVDGAGHLYLADGKRGAPSDLNTDRYSGFIRQPEGALASAEQGEISHLKAYHDNVAFSSSARIFPRHVDAFLIGGLRQAIGDDYLHTKSIHAAYRLSGGRVLVDSIVADGHTVGGAIDLSTVSAGCSG